jgi:hypothetical protein
MGREENRKLALQVRGGDPGQWKGIVTQAISENHIPDDVRSLILQVIGQTASREISPSSMGAADPKDGFLRKREVYSKVKNMKYLFMPGLNWFREMKSWALP